MWKILLILVSFSCSTAVPQKKLEINTVRVPYCVRGTIKIKDKVQNIKLCVEKYNTCLHAINFVKKYGNYIDIIEVGYCKIEIKE